jgi:hypothetical protein
MKAYTCAPVLLTVFNRPDETRQVLARLKQVRPEKIFIAADGPRAGRSEDELLCEEVRRLVTEEIDWPATILTDFAPSNLGLRHRMASAITWALQHEDRVIVLEDDCVPDPTFFRFCTELLERFKDDARVGVITGDNFQSEGFECGASYYFSRYPHCWGWATWRRAWDLYDVTMAEWLQVRQTDWLQTMYQHPLEALYWRQIFDKTYIKEINTWDYQWTYICWRFNMLTVTPALNLVTNVGTQRSATNTKHVDKAKHHLKCYSMEFPLNHPHTILRKSFADDFVQRTHFGRAKDPSLLGQLKRLTAKIAKIPRRISDSLQQKH